MEMYLSVVFHRGGWDHEVRGLGGVVSRLRGVADQVAGAYEAAISSANRALEDWHGRHADAFTELLAESLRSEARFVAHIDGTADALEAFPGGSGQPRVGRPDLRLERSRLGGAVGMDPAVVGLVSHALAPDDGVWAAASRAFSYSGVTVRRTRHTGPTYEEHAEWVRPESVLPTLDDGGWPARLHAMRAAAADLARATAGAIGDADVLALLAAHPELAMYFLDAGSGGNHALAMLLAVFDQVDADGDGEVSRDELEAIESGDPPHVRAAAQWLLGEADVWAIVATIDSPFAQTLRSDPPDGGADRHTGITVAQIGLFLKRNLHLAALAPHLARVAADTTGVGDGTALEPGSVLSVANLHTALEDGGLPADAVAAVRWLLRNPQQFTRLANHTTPSGVGGGLVPVDEPMDWIGVDQLVAATIDSQAFGGDPRGAAAFVSTLPIVDRGETGLSIFLTGDRGVQVLADEALVATAGELTGQHGVIAHLPETTGAVRNQLITAFYNELSLEFDALLNGPLAGEPQAEGHTGANWLTHAPWPSEAIRSVIIGKQPVATPGMRQAAADGNQWIFNDIGSRVTGFLELYDNGTPTTAEQQAFYDSFDAGEQDLRDAFAVYADAAGEADPVDRQHQTFAANGMIALHEQAGVQPWLDTMSWSFNRPAAAFVNLEYGPDRRVHVDLDLDPDRFATANNHVASAPLLSLDFADLDTNTLSTAGGGRFSTGGTDDDDVVHLPDIGGVEGVSDSLAEWHAGGSDGLLTPWRDRDADGYDNTGAYSWPNWEERQYMIIKLFELAHTDAELWDTAALELDFGHGNFDYLTQETGLVPK